MGAQPGLPSVVRTSPCVAVYPLSVHFGSLEAGGVSPALPPRPPLEGTLGRPWVLLCAQPWCPFPRLPPTQRETGSQRKALDPGGSYALGSHSFMMPPHRQDLAHLLLVKQS